MSKFRWGDAEDDEDVLPEPTTTGPNEKGIVTKTEYLHNSKGEAVKKTTTIQLVKVKTRVYEVRFERMLALDASSQSTPVSWWLWKTRLGMAGEVKDADTTEFLVMRRAYCRALKCVHWGSMSFEVVSALLCMLKVLYAFCA
jgi:hypothetical protein